MSTSSLIGTRVRERRIAAGLRQVELAKIIGISPSYLNLIEHNRRRIGGKLVHELARALAVPPAILTEGAQAQMIDALREAAEGHAAANEAVEQLEDFATRYPAWAQLMSDTAHRAKDLERAVEVLTDRMTHDPYLSTSMHDVLSTVTAIRSTAAILVETPDIDAEWRHRFHRNLEEDAARLADGAEALVRYLDSAAETEAVGSTPFEEFDAWLRGNAYHFPALESDPTLPVDVVLRKADGLQSRAAHALAAMHLERYRADAERMPFRRFCAAVTRLGCDPAGLAQSFATDLPRVFRRIASLPSHVLRAPVGLASCDGSGTLTFRKPIPGFDLPRHATACPLWPLYEALAHPMTPVQRLVTTTGRSGGSFVTFATCQPRQITDFNAPAILEASMLIVPPDLVPGALGQRPRGVGISCRICPRSDCPARREASLIADRVPEPAGSAP